MTSANTKSALVGRFSTTTTFPPRLLLCTVTMWWRKRYNFKTTFLWDWISFRKLPACFPAVPSLYLRLFVHKTNIVQYCHDDKDYYYYFMIIEVDLMLCYLCCVFFVENTNSLSDFVLEKKFLVGNIYHISRFRRHQTCDVCLCVCVVKQSVTNLLENRLA